MEADEIERLQAWIGRTESVSALVEADVVRRFCATFSLSEVDPVVGDTAPPLIHFCLGQPTAPTAALGEDGHPPRGGFCRRSRCLVECGPAGR